MRNFVEELITLNKEDLMQLPKEFILALFLNYNDCIKVRLERKDEDGLGVELTKDDLFNVIEESQTIEEFEKWMEDNHHFIDMSDF